MLGCVCVCEYYMYIYVCVHGVITNLDCPVLKNASKHGPNDRGGKKKPSIHSSKQPTNPPQQQAYLERQRRHNHVTPKSFLELIGFYKARGRVLSFVSCLSITVCFSYSRGLYRLGVRDFWPAPGPFVSECGLVIFSGRRRIHPTHTSYYHTTPHSTPQPHSTC